MTRRRTLLRVWAFLVFLLAVRSLGAGLLGSRGERPTVREWLVDCNRASVGELQTLPTIGRLRAEAMVLHRVRHGPWRSAEDLARVDGIGPDAVERLRRLVTFGR